MAAYDEAITEFVRNTDLLGVNWEDIVAELMAFVEVATHLAPSLSEGVAFTDTASGISSWALTISEAVDASDDISSDTALFIREVLSVLVELSPAGSIHNHTVAEGIAFLEAVAIAVGAIISESAVFADTVVGTAERIVVIAEQVALSGAYATRLDAIEVVSIVVALVDTAAAGKGGAVTEAMTLTDSVTDIATLYALSAEALILAATPSMTGVLTLPVEETVVVAADMTLQQILVGLIEEGVAFVISFGLDDVVYSGWVMNASNFAVSQYDSLPFNSFAKIGDTYYGANQTGLYSLDGDSDDGENINAELVLGTMDFTKDRKTTVPECFLSLRTDGSILLKVITDNQTVQVYELTETTDVLRDRREKLARGVKSRYWTFSLLNVDGSDFELRNFDPVPIILKRR